MPSTPRQAAQRWPYAELLIGLVAGGLVLWQLWSNPGGWVGDAFADRRKDLYNAVLGLSGSLLGFVLATLAIVIGYAQSARFAVLRQTRWHQALYRTFLQCVRTLLATVIFSLVALFADEEKTPVPVLAAATTAAVAASLMRLARTMAVFHQVVNIVITSGARGAGD